MQVFRHSETYDSFVNSFIEDDEEVEEDAETRMRRMFANRGTASLELFEAGCSHGTKGLRLPNNSSIQKRQLLGNLMS